MRTGEDVLFAFAMEENITPSVLRRYVIDNPSLTEGLLLLYDELALENIEEQFESDVEDIVIDEEISHRISLAKNALYGEKLPETAEKLSLPRSFISGIRASFVKVSTIPANILTRLAKEIGVYSPDLVMAMFEPKPKTYYRATKKPVEPEAIDFWTYVNNSGLTKEQEEIVQSMVSNDSLD